MDNIQFANPEYFYLFIIIPIMIVWYILRRKKQSPTLKVSSSEGFANYKPTLRQRLRHFLIVFRVLAISLFIFALARPQTSSSEESISTEGIDIVIALDISTSMLAEDFSPNRLQSAKITAMEFVDERQDDRIGLVVFAGESFTQCPVTIDHDVLKNLFISIKSGMIQDGTAIGSGLATAVNRLKDSDAKSKVVVLLTDGDNNSGNISPESAADIAATFGIRVYTIGVGSKGTAPFPFETPFGTRYQNIEVKINEEVLKSIAEVTGGQYFRATNTKALKSIYKQIDEMEKTKVDVAYFSKHTEEYLPFAMAGLALLFLEVLLGLTIFRKLP